MKQLLAEAIKEHISINDTYVYNLTRDKQAFEVGTMTVDDFEEWNEEDVEGLADSIVDKLSPSLTADQQVVLEWLKEEYKRTKWSSPFGTVYSTINIHEMFVRMRLTKAQQFQVLAAFAEWGCNQ